MSKKFRHLNLSPHWQQYFSKYPQGYTIIENLIDWVSQVDDMVDNQNELNGTIETYGNRLDEFIGQFEENLQGTVSDTLEEWQNSGFLEVVVSEALNTKYHEMDDRLTSQLANTVGVSAREYGILGDNSDETVKIQQLINENDVIVFPIPENDFYGISGEIIFDSDKTIVFKGANNVTNTNTNDVTFKWVGTVAPNKSMFRLSRTPVGVEPTSSLQNIKFEGNVLLNGGGLVGYGLYGAFLSYESHIQNVAVSSTTKTAIEINKSWYARYDNLTASYNLGEGVVIGRHFWGGINGVKFSVIRGHTNGRGKTWTEANALVDCGVFIRLGYGSSVDTVVAEDNYGAGLVYQLGSGNTQTIHNVYLEGNNIAALNEGKTSHAWGTIVESEGVGEAKRIDNITFTGPVDKPQSLWIRGEGNAIVDISDFYGMPDSIIKADNKNYRLSGSGSYFMVDNLEGHLPLVNQTDKQTTYSTLYIGSNGNDNNSGLANDQPISTFTRALEILENHKEITTIHLINYQSSSIRLDLRHVTQPINLTAENSKVSSLILIENAKNITIEGISQSTRIEVLNSNIFVKNTSFKQVFDIVSHGTIHLRNSKMLLDTFTVDGSGSQSGNRRAFDLENSELTICNYQFSGYSDNQIFTLSKGSVIKTDKYHAGIISANFSDNTGAIYSTSRIQLPNGALALP